MEALGYLEEEPTPSERRQPQPTPVHHTHPELSSEEMLCDARSKQEHLPKRGTARYPEPVLEGILLSQELKQATGAWKAHRIFEFRQESPREENSISTYHIKPRVPSKAYKPAAWLQREHWFLWIRFQQCMLSYCSYKVVCWYQSTSEPSRI